MKQPQKLKHMKKTKKKKSLDSFAKTVYNIFLNNPFNEYNFRQISHQLGISDKASREIVKNILSQLQESESIVSVKRGKYKLNSANLKTIPNNIIEGIVDMKQTGKAYIINDELDEDIFVGQNNTYHALNKDKVKVLLFPKRKGKKPEGRIIEIISRNRTQFVGIVQVSKRFAFLVPDDITVPVDIYISLNDLNGAKNGEKAIAEIKEWPENSKNPFGVIVEVLGNPGDNDVEMSSILVDNNFPLHFPEKVSLQAKKINNKIPIKEISKRRDFRNVFTCTIDPPDANDYDDALSLKKMKNGNWQVGIHIADVSYYVKPNSDIDKEAYKRGTSVYLVDRVIPMLPEILSNNVCSLRPNEEKLCFSAVFDLDDDANVINQWFGKTIINSNRRFNYDEVQKIIEEGKGDFKDEILILNKLAKKLREKRLKKGSINFKSQEVKFVLDDKGKPVEVYIKEQKESNMLVEDFMLLANKEVAKLIGMKKDKANTFVYRIHDRPNPEKLNTFAEFVKKLGYNLKINSKKNISDSINNLFTQIAGKGEENMIETIAVRTMAKAEYSTKNIGHYGLAFKYYTHFTSPIRRYPDLMVHRLLNLYLNNKKSVNKAEYEEYCKHCSEMERKSVEAERASIKYKQAEFLLDKIGCEFDGLISGVSKWGIFVELIENRCEGMVSIKHLTDDYYFLDEENYCITGQRHGKQFRLGDKVRIVVSKINLQKKQMDFKLV